MALGTTRPPTKQARVTRRAGVGTRVRPPRNRPEVTAPGKRRRKKSRVVLPVSVPKFDKPPSLPTAHITLHEAIEVLRREDAMVWFERTSKGRNVVISSIKHGMQCGKCGREMTPGRGCCEDASKDIDDLRFKASQYDYAQAALERESKLSSQVALLENKVCLAEEQVRQLQPYKDLVDQLMDTKVPGDRRTVREYLRDMQDELDL